MSETNGMPWFVLTRYGQKGASIMGDKSPKKEVKAPKKDIKEKRRDKQEKKSAKDASNRNTI